MDHDSVKLNKVLHDVFGFKAFRPHQQAVCEATVNGEDVLLVMPTGAGKSLCYQLPGLVRGDTTLVISPLLALIEDQVAKLQSLGLKADRIHSGRDRETSRQVCMEYIQGHLDYLFIAPERLAVPGFIELLARRKLALIAIDEAHCISQWGHDFRPEYRMLGQRIQSLRPAPVIALTATATPRVQEEIVALLGLKRTRRFIHGFRRSNIAIEVVEMNPGTRIDALQKLLLGEGRVPAVVYAPTRKRAEEAADALKKNFKAKAYHAGLKPEQRDRIQTDFLTGRLEVIVATVAFGMGIDKSDIRTVAHLALPSSVESYYQEIGRAGRDGEISKAVLLYSFIDRKTHEFFFERDYPEPKVLEKIYNLLTHEPTPTDDIGYQARVGDNFENALEKLWINGGAVIDQDQNVSRGSNQWLAPYKAHCAHRQGQLNQMQRYAESATCRMIELVHYFGDRGEAPCGICDICAPENTVLKTKRDLDRVEAEIAIKILRALAAAETLTTGKLHRDFFDEKTTDRRDFERVLAALTSAKLVQIYEDSFEKDGKTISFRRASLTTDGRHLVRSPLDRIAEWVQIPERLTSSSKKKTMKRKFEPRPRSITSAAGEVSYDSSDLPSEVSPAILAALKAWRLSEARNKRVPAFRVLSDRVLMGIAALRPSSEDALFEVHGMGPKLVAKYGAQLLDIVRSEN